MNYSTYVPILNLSNNTHSIYSPEDEIKELEEHVSGRVHSLRGMFNQGNSAISPEDKKVVRENLLNRKLKSKGNIPTYAYFPKAEVVFLILDGIIERKTKQSHALFKGSLDSIANESIRRQREIRDKEKQSGNLKTI
jgi:hypothetical protein